MERAVVLAKKAGERARPNPRVGAVVVRGGKKVGEGFHKVAGGAHAEVVALGRAGARARGADLYVTLEPCSTWGRTPPCTEALARAGIQRVIYGAGDVDRRNAGGAGRILARKKIRVVKGVLRTECEELNEDYRHWTTRKEPWVILKLAMTLDGFLAVPGRRWITGAVARAEVQKLREGCDAILVGAETVRKDNPRLTVRTGKGAVQPWRVVVTRSGKLPKKAKIFTDAHRRRTLVYQKKSWDWILRDLHRRGVCRLLVEGGAKVAEGMVKAGKVQEAVLYFAPVVAGEVRNHSARVRSWERWGWGKIQSSCAGQDLRLHGKLRKAK